MSKRNNIYIVDSDNEYRQELVSQFATAVEDYKLCGVKSLSEIDQLFINGRIKHGKNYLVVASEQFEKNGHPLSETVQRYSRNHSVQQIIVYAPNVENVDAKVNSIPSKKLKAIAQNDFTFYRVQNIIRNAINLSEYNNARLGFAISLTLFAVLVVWFYMV